jgi:hypothetical protein
MSRSICYDDSRIRLLFAFYDLNARIRFDFIRRITTWQMTVARQ